MYTLPENHPSLRLSKGQVTLSLGKRSCRQERWKKEVNLLLPKRQPPAGQQAVDEAAQRPGKEAQVPET